MVQHVAEAGGKARPERGGNGRRAHWGAGALHAAGKAAGDGAPAAIRIRHRGEAFEHEGAGKLRRVGLGIRVWRAEGALALCLDKAETVEAARAAGSRQSGQSRPWTEGRQRHGEGEEMQQATDHRGEHGKALPRGAPNGRLVPVPHAGNQEALQGIMMLRRKAPEFGERGCDHQGQKYTPARGPIGLASADTRRGRGEWGALGESYATNFWVGAKTLTSHYCAMGPSSPTSRERRGPPPEAVGGEVRVTET